MYRNSNNSLAPPVNVFTNAANSSTTGHDSHALKRPFSGPTWTIASINIEGLSRNKEEILSEICRTANCDVLCVQETHRGEGSKRPKIDGMRLVAEIPHEKHGSAIFAKMDVTISTAETETLDGIELICINMGNCSISSIYKPPGKEFTFRPLNACDPQNPKIVIGDFNSHSTSWGYSETDRNGSLVEEWAESNDLALIHDAKLPPSFNSNVWKRGTNPDLCFVSSTIEARCCKSVLDPIPKTQHRPIAVSIYPAVRTQEVPFRRRFNFRKANWPAFASEVDRRIAGLPPSPRNYEEFVDIVKAASRRHIPRGCRTHHISGMDTEAKKLMDEYKKSYEDDPFGQGASKCGNSLLSYLGEVRQRKWEETVKSMDMTHNSRKAWSLIRKLSGDPTERKAIASVTPNQIAHQLLLNGKTSSKCRVNRYPKTGDSLGLGLLKSPFTPEEMVRALMKMKNGKSPGIDELCTEQVKNLGPMANCWLLDLFNNCRTTYEMPKSWRKAKVIAIAKPGKDPNHPSSYRPISLLCHLFKLYERLILQRIEGPIDELLIPQQAGFRPGRSCASQVLALTEHIEQGYEKQLITGVAFVDLSAAYDTVNHKLLFEKIFRMTRDRQLTMMITSILQNRRFFVNLDGKNSRWRIQKNGLPQGSVLAPILFNIYTNDQPMPDNTVCFAYADDLAITAQAKEFADVERTLQTALSTYSNYYRTNSLKPNPSKTVICAFHLRSHSAKRKLNVEWEGAKLINDERPKYLGVTLDRSLTYKAHCEKTAKKVDTRNNVLRKLRGTHWGAKPNTLRITAKALCFSSGEYACNVWGRSAHAKKVDVRLNQTCRLITGCMMPTKLEKLYKAAGWAQPNTRRMASYHIERVRQLADPKHPLHDSHVIHRLKSRRSFLRAVPDEPPEMFPIVEEPPPGIDLDWDTWKTLSRIRSGVAPVKENLIKWKIIEDTERCECGQRQDMKHLFECPLCPVSCKPEDLWSAESSYLDLARYWAGKL
jgi:Reverse transcriptase (RNA-dependent DNA polymerase)/Endonuclease-reverse transcriptase